MGGRVRTRAASKPKLVNATPARAVAIADQLAARWRDARVELDHRDAFELLVATILAAQSTDKMINTITPALFAKYPDAAALAAAEPAELEPMIYRSGFYRAKARNLLAMARKLVADHGGKVPETMDELCALPGVARKTANVVLGCALGKAEGIVVDTHVTRVAARLGMTANTDPVKIERDLTALLPRDRWIAFSTQLVHHGRYICQAKQPRCDDCPLAPLCPSAFTFGPAPRKPAPAPAPRARPRRARP